MLCKLPAVPIMSAIFTGLAAPGYCLMAVELGYIKQVHGPAVAISGRISAGLWLCWAVTVTVLGCGCARLWLCPCHCNIIHVSMLLTRASGA